MNSWESTSFTAIEIHKHRIEKTFVVPMYQRGFVWKPKQEEEFIDTLKRGLPFGTILLYRDDIKNEYQIIDGLQRCTTIYKFISHPAPFFNEDDIEENVPQQLAKITGVANASAIINDIENNLISWVHGAFRTMEEVRDMEAGDYAFVFSSFYPSAKGHEQEISKIVKPTLKKFKNLCEGLCSVKIPAIVIKGDDDALPIIFERINSKGMQLSKYQIYKATWTRKYDINSSKVQDIIKYNKELYENMESDGTDIVDFDAADF